MRAAPSSRIGVLVALLLTAAACSGGDDTTDPTDVSAATAAEATAVSTAEVPPPSAAPDPAGGAATIDDTTAPPLTDATTTTVGAIIPGLGPLTLLTGGDGLGVRPVLQWSPVDGAAEYVVVVNTADGGPYWTWQGAGTEVAFGGGPIEDPDTTGARLISPKTWFVVALDAAAQPIAASEPGALGP